MPALKAIVRKAPVVLTIDLIVAGDLIDQNIFIADRNYTVEEVRWSHAVAGSGGAASVDVKKCTGTTAAASGTTVLGSTFDLTATANTVVTKNRANAGVVSTPVATLAAGDRLALDFTGTLTSMTQGTMTVVLSPVTGVPGR
jgi:hypothetical protein